MTHKILHPEWLDWPQTQTLIKAFEGRKQGLCFVGGAVRDALLGRPVTDVDVATPLRPEMVQALLEKAGIRAVPTGIAHGTVTAVIDGKHFEITTLRRDIKTDGRHATVAYTEDWREDAKRRDFTMNALYLSPEGELCDYVDGEADARAGHVRFIGRADARIHEDYLRILRFFRFYAHYGVGEADAQALEACKKQAVDIARISGERIQHEMLRLLAAPAPYKTIAYMEQCAINAFGMVTESEALARLEQVEAILGKPSSALVRLAILIGHDPFIDGLAARWKLSTDMKKYLHMLLLWGAEMSLNLSLAGQKSLLRKLGADVFKEVVLLRWAHDGVAAGRSVYPPMLAFADSWQIPTFPLRGDDLKQAGIAEGKAMGEALKRLELLWEESDYTWGKAQLLAKL